MKIFSGSSNRPLAQKIAENLNLKLSELDIHIFPDGEKRVRTVERVVDEDCIIVQPTSNPGDSHYMELFFITDALKRSGAKSVTAVIPYLGYQRQDHVFRDGEAVSLEVIVETLERVGVDKVIAFDLHSIKIPEVFTIPVTHLSALPQFGEKIRSLKLKDFVLVSPDMGGIRRIKLISDILGGASFAVVDKDRDLETGEISVKEVQGNVKGKTAVIVDDIISSGNTIVKAASTLLRKGAEKVLVFATHPVFSEDSASVLENAAVEKVYVTDSIFIPKDKHFKKLEVISISNLIAKNL